MERIQVGLQPLVDPPFRMKARHLQDMATKAITRVLHMAIIMVSTWFSHSSVKTEHKCILINMFFRC